MPDPDLVVRTSGEYRISNFLIWELAYSELVFTDVLWPDFRREHLVEAVRELQRRERRFGGRSTSPRGTQPRGGPLSRAAPPPPAPPTWRGPAAPAPHSPDVTR